MHFLKKMSFTITHRSRKINEIKKFAEESGSFAVFKGKVATLTGYHHFEQFAQQSMSYYAVAAGWEVGIFQSWPICESKVKGFSKPKYKKFKTRQEAEAFLETNGVNMKTIANSSDPRNDAVPLTASGGTSRSFLNATKTGASVLSSKTYMNLEKPSLPEIADNWPDDAEWNEGDDDLLLTAAAEIEGIPGNLKRKGGPSVASVSKTLKKYQHDSKIWEPMGLKKIGNFEFPIDSEGYVIVYTDGSCINNGQANAVAGFGVYFSEGHALNAAKPVNGRVTNNAGEIQAAIYAINLAKDFGIAKLCLSTDSQFLINAATMWIKGWKRKGWMLSSGEPVKNVDDFKILDRLLDGSVDIKWNYVKGHKGIIGNEKADRLARQGAALYREIKMEK